MKEHIVGEFKKSKLLKDLEMDISNKVSEAIFMEISIFSFSMSDDCMIYHLLIKL